MSTRELNFEELAAFLSKKEAELKFLRERRDQLKKDLEELIGGKKNVSKVLEKLDREIADLREKANEQLQAFEQECEKLK